MSSSWTDRIYNLEVNPPGEVWERVAASLDDSYNRNSFPGMLYNYESEPPADTWNKIKNFLKTEEAPVIHIKQHNPLSSFLKYAVAACIIGLLAFGAIRYYNSSTDKIDVAVAPGILPSNTDTPVISDKSQKVSIPAQNDTDDLALEQSKNTYARLDMNSRNFSSKINRRLYGSPAKLASAFNEMSIENSAELQYPHRAAVTDSPSDNSSGRYIMFKNNHGQYVRVSKKLSDLFCCVSGEQQDEDCSNQLKKWREKMATSSFTPSPDNFMDILDLVNSLQDNRN